MQNQNQGSICFDCLDSSTSLKIAEEIQLLCLARLYNLGLAAVVTSLNAYSSEAECVCKYFMFEPEEGRRDNKCLFLCQEAFLLGLSPWFRQGSTLLVLKQAGRGRVSLVEKHKIWRGRNQRRCCLNGLFRILLFASQVIEAGGNLKLIGFERGFFSASSVLCQLLKTIQFRDLIPNLINFDPEYRQKQNFL